MLDNYENKAMTEEKEEKKLSWKERHPDYAKNYYLKNHDKLLTYQKKRYHDMKDKKVKITEN